MANKIRDVTGHKFGRLYVVAITSETNNQGRKLWECKCDCGKVIKIISSSLVSGTTKSCGCLLRESASITMITRTNSLTKEQALLSRIVVDEKSKCWNWIGSKDKDGYGLFHWRNKCFRAHRESLSVLKSVDVPKHLVVCHSCDNPSCINPDHLFIGTAKDNAQDALKKKRAFVGVKNGRAKLTQEQVNQIRIDTDHNKDIASKYAVSRHTVSSIKRGITWK